MKIKKTKQCIFCKTTHTNKKRGTMDVIADVCFRCNFMSENLEACVKALNNFVQTGEVRPRRKLTIKDFKIEKI